MPIFGFAGDDVRIVPAQTFHHESIAGIGRAACEWPVQVDQVRDGRLSVYWLIAYLHNVPVGFLAFEPITMNRSELATVVVHPDRRKVGVGRALVERMVVMCRVAHRDVLVFTVRDDQSGTAGVFFRQVFRSLGIKPRVMLRRGPEDTIRFRLDLSPALADAACVGREP